MSFHRFVRTRIYAHIFFTHGEATNDRIVRMYTERFARRISLDIITEHFFSSSSSFLVDGFQRKYVVRAPLYLIDVSSCFYIAVI